MSRKKTIVSESSEPVLKMDSLTRLRSSVISEHSTIRGQSNTEAWLMSLRRDSPVNPSVKQGSVELRTTIEICGPQHAIVFEPCGLKLSSSRTSLESSVIYPRCLRIYEDSATALSNQDSPPPPKWVKDLSENGSSYLPTPSAVSYGTNQGGGAGRVGKIRKSLSGLLGGPPNPEWLEWFMGWPIGWTDTKPLEMDRFQQWLQGFGRS